MTDLGLLGWYRGRRVLVTGHTGFKGSWLSAWLQRAGAEVYGAALPPDGDRPSLFSAIDLADRIRSEFVDVRDLSAVERVMKEAKPELVFHLAAQSLVRRSYSEPLDTFATNIMGTAHVLEASRQIGSVRAVVVVTSDKCYENDGRQSGYVESDRLGGFDPYSASKGCAEIVTAAYRRSFLADADIAVATARAGNVIGGGDWAPNRLVPDIMMATAAGRPIQIRNPEAVRPWQHVLEALRGYLMLGEALVERGALVADSWNFGPGDGGAMPVRDVVDHLQTLWREVTPEYPVIESAVHEAHYLTLDCTKANTTLGWRSSMDIGQTLERTVRWYQQYYRAPNDASRLVREALASYEHSIDTEGAAP